MATAVYLADERFSYFIYVTFAILFGGDTIAFLEAKSMHI